MNAEERRSMVDWFAGVVADKITEPRQLEKPCFTRDDFHKLFGLMLDECQELSTAHHMLKSVDATIAEAADVAAFACFIAYNALSKRVKALDSANESAK